MKLTSLRFALVLALIAALLAFSAALITFVRRGEVEATPVAGGLFMLALAYYLSRDGKSGGVK